MGNAGKDVIGNLKDEFRPSQVEKVVEEVKKEVISEEDWTEE